MGVVDHIRQTVARLDPTYPCEVEFYDEIFDHLYHQERNLSTMILLFSLLAVIISIVGIFGLVIFETQYRRKRSAFVRYSGPRFMRSWLCSIRFISVLSAFALS